MQKINRKWLFKSNYQLNSRLAKIQFKSTAMTYLTKNCDQRAENTKLKIIFNALQPLTPSTLANRDQFSINPRSQHQLNRKPHVRAVTRRPQSDPLNNEISEQSQGAPHYC